MLYSSFPILTYHGRRHVVSRKVSQVPTFGHFLGLLSTYNVANERYRINLFRQPCQSTIGRDWPDMDEKLRFRDQLWVYLWKEDMIVFTVIVFVTGLSSGEPRHTDIRLYKKKSHVKTFCCTYLYFLEVALRRQESTTSTLKSNEMICSWYVPLLCRSKFMHGSQAFIKSMKVNMIGFVQLNHWLSHFIWKIIIYFHKNNFVWQVRYWHSMIFINYFNYQYILYKI